MDRSFDKVLVRPPGKSYKDCLSKNPYHDKIDLDKTLKQHTNYVKKLESAGIEIEELPPLEAYPDSIFVQDTALIGESSKKAVICRMGVPERRGEEDSIAEHLREEGYRIKKIEPPGTLEGGDILVTDKDKIFVGISERTNESGIEQLADFFPDVEVIGVPVSHVFHLLSGVNFVGDGALAVCPDIVDKEHFDDFDMIEITKAEQDTRYENKPINLLYLGDKTIMLPHVYKRTKDIFEDLNFEVLSLNISEFWKGDAGMTCPMLPYYKGI